MDWTDIPADLRVALLALVREAVREAVRPAVAEALTEALPEVVRRAALPEFLSRKEVCALTGWSDRHLSYLQAEGRIAFHKRGRVVRFKPDDIFQFIDESRVEAKRVRGPEAQ